MDDVLTNVTDGVRTIRINEPERKNAMSTDSFIKMTTILNEDANSNDIILTIITGTGEYFTSGNESKETHIQKNENPQHCMLDNANVLVKFFNAMISYPKTLVAVVNGPAVGVGVTMIGLCDVVYASETATFHTPFVDLGACVEACASYAFPRSMGKSKGSEMLILGHKLAAREALQFGLVSKVVPRHKLGELCTQLQGYGNLAIVRTNNKISEDLIEMCERRNRECETMKKIVVSEEFVNDFIPFITKNKL